jgi:hypothetical protein
LDRDPDPHLVVEGGRIDPIPAADGVVRFSIDAPTHDIILASRTCIPQAYGLGPDQRRLGLGIFALTVKHPDGKRAVDMASEELAAGFHACEGTIRWTKGWATLPASLFAGMRGQVEIELHVAGELLYPCGIEPSDMCGGFAA